MVNIHVTVYLYCGAQCETEWRILTLFFWLCVAVVFVTQATFLSISKKQKLLGKKRHQWRVFDFGIRRPPIDSCLCFREVPTLGIVNAGNSNSESEQHETTGAVSLKFENHSGNACCNFLPRVSYVRGSVFCRCCFALHCHRRKCYRTGFRQWCNESSYRATRITARYRLAFILIS